MMMKIKRIVSYLVLNGALAGSLYFGFVQGINGAENIAYALAWFAIIGGFFAGGNDNVRKAVRDAGRSVPAWLNHTIDIGVLGVLFWFGAWFTGIFWVIHMLLLLEVHKETLDKDGEVV